MKCLSVALAAVVLCACGIAAQQEADAQLEASLAAYRACVLQHQDNVMECDTGREIYEAELLGSKRPRSVFSKVD